MTDSETIAAQVLKCVQDLIHCHYCQIKECEFKLITKFGFRGRRESVTAGDVSRSRRGADSDSESGQLASDLI